MYALSSTWFFVLSLGSDCQVVLSRKLCGHTRMVARTYQAVAKTLTIHTALCSLNYHRLFGFIPRCNRKNAGKFMNWMHSIGLMVVIFSTGSLAP
jgi:hypothetical protein